MLGTAAACKLAVVHAINIGGRELGLRRGGSLAVRLAGRSWRHPVTVRVFGSDFQAARQVLVGEEHRCVAGLANVRLIIDCGANVGYSAAYLASQYPDADLIALEPDAANFELLLRNTAAFGPRITCLRAAVWNKPTSMRTVRGAYRDGLDWSTTVIEDSDGGGTIDAVTISQVIRGSGHNRVGLLKVDVEGSEERLFDESACEWLDATDNLCIELHGRGCESRFNECMSAYQFERSTHEELVVCKKIRRRTSISA